ncbi:MAG: adenylyltransferase/cytidyltransferase family protein [Gemmatimonadota bacterium]|nr:adenylyltransferase/cytidyltransferase family protein [Gemmatimonadota bacterium]
MFTNGCFDLLHRGHVECLVQARALGDALLVAINTDDSVRRLGKGPDRPLVTEGDRAMVLAALECVDWVTSFHEDTPEALVAELEPDVLVKGGDYAEDEVAGAAAVRSRGGRLVILPRVAGYSTSGLVRRLKKQL